MQNPQLLKLSTFSQNKHISENKHTFFDRCKNVYEESNEKYAADPKKRFFTKLDKVRRDRSGSLRVKKFQISQKRTVKFTEDVKWSIC